MKTNTEQDHSDIHFSTTFWILCLIVMIYIGVTLKNTHPIAQENNLIGTHDIVNNGTLTQ